MNRLEAVMKKRTLNILGLMSGTSLDGVDAALVRIEGCGTDTKMELLHYGCIPFPEGLKERIFALFQDRITAAELCHMNFLLGEVFADAALTEIRQAERETGISLYDLDLIASHGQTIYHIPEPVEDLGYDIRSTLQIGEGAVIARRTNTITISDFRVMDMAAGGQGAPLVPYADFLLYRRNDRTVALQNIGGISNITILPQGCTAGDVIAFDTGPGNMIIDEFVRIWTNGCKEYDPDGVYAKRGTVNEAMLAELMTHPYLKKPYPKTTGREMFGASFAHAVWDRWRDTGVAEADMIATATAFTAESIVLSARPFHINELIVGGGGARNLTLMDMLRRALPGVYVCTQEDLGFNGDAKEAAAFAILANETIHGNPNDLISVTGAVSPQIMGKINLV